VVVVVIVRVHVLDLDTAVVTAVAADAVRTAWLMALRALGQRSGSDLVLRTTLIGAGVRLFLLWDGHSDEGD